MNAQLDNLTSIQGITITLYPLQKDHLKDLKMIASDKRIWEYYIMDVSDSENFSKEFEQALVQKENGSQFPFVIFHNKKNKLIGSTRFLDIQPQHRKLEIGWTWIVPEYWGTPVNAECKLLLLTFCFETLNLSRVQLKTDENNLRSRKAIEKIGGKFEGIIRNDMLRENGTKRNSALYAITDTDWSDVKPKLAAILRSNP